MNEYCPRPETNRRISRRGILLVGIAGLAGCMGEDTTDVEDETDDTSTNGDEPNDGAAASTDDSSEASDEEDDTDSEDESAQPSVDEDDILEVLDTYWEAWMSGDRETGENVVSEDAPLREESWWDEPWEDIYGLGIEVDVIDRTVVDSSDGRYVVEQRTEWDVPEEPPGIATDEFIFHVEETGAVVWEMNEVEWETIHEGEPTRLIALEKASDLDAELAFEIAESLREEALQEIDGDPTIVLDPHGDTIYNAAARTRFDAFLNIVNTGATSIDRLVADLSVTGTENDEAHEAAISFIRDEEVVPLNGEANVLTQPLEPDETATIGLELDLLDSGISDIEAEAAMEIVFRSE